MKAFQFFRVVLVLGGLLLSACAGAPASQAVSVASSAGGDKSLSEVVFTGSIDGMNGDQWVIDGQTIKVDASILRDGPFTVGDTVKVEAQVAGDGSVTAQRVESTSGANPAESVTSTPEVAPTQPSQTLDNNTTEVIGSVEAITSTSITVNGQTYALAPGAEIKGTIQAGTLAKLHFVTSAEGTLLVREVTSADPAQVTDQSNNGSSNDRSNGTNVSDDHSNDTSNDSSGGSSISDDHSSSTGDDSSSGSQGSDDSSNHDSGDDSQGGGSSDNGSDDSGNHG